MSGHSSFKRISGDDSYVVPPVPIPNTVVKHIYAESTCLETDWEDRELPVKARHLRWQVSFLFLSFFSQINAGFLMSVWNMNRAEIITECYLVIMANVLRWGGI